MPRYRKLRPNLYSADLVYGKIDLKPGHGVSCFFIVQHIDDKEFIKDGSILRPTVERGWILYY